MRTFAFAKRTAKEILRDKLTLIFGLGFPIILIFLLSAIQANIPVPLFEIDRLAPAMTVFGLSFMTLFSATLIAKDRDNSFITRLYATPMRALDFILGYTIPLIPISLMQSIICFIAGLVLGMKITVNIIFSILFIIPISIFFIGMGLMFGSLLNQKQVGGICGALFTNLTAWFSGIWFDLELVGGAFEFISNLLPFVHAVQLVTLSFSGNFEDILLHLFVVLIYALLSIFLSVSCFLHQMKRG